MLNKRFGPLALSALLIASPLLLAEEAHQHSQAAPTATTEAAPPAEGKVAPSAGTTMAEAVPMGAPGVMPQQGVMSEPENDTDQGSATTQMQGGPGMMGGGKMGRGMMGHGGGGMMGHGGGRTMGGGDHGMGGHGMMKKHQEVLNRLDLLEARLAKIEVMLERLMQR